MISELAAFAGGVLFGTAGVKALGSKDAKKAYAHTAAFGLRVKDSVMKTITEVKENANDILAEAKEINEKKPPKHRKKQNRALLKTQLLQTHKLSKGCQIGSLLAIRGKYYEMSNLARNKKQNESAFLQRKYDN